MLSKQEHCDRVLKLWKPIREKMYWVIVKIVNDRNLAEDILQESLVTAIEKFQTLRDESKFESWFITISIRKAYEIIAAKQAFFSIPSIEDGSFFESIDTQPISSKMEYDELILYILNHLESDVKKYLFYLKYVEDRSTEDIVRITGIKEGTVKSIYSRMRKELENLIGKEYSYANQ